MGEHLKGPLARGGEELEGRLSERRGGHLSGHLCRHLNGRLSVRLSGPGVESLEKVQGATRLGATGPRASERETCL